MSSLLLKPLLLFLIMFSQVTVASAEVIIKDNRQIAGQMKATTSTSPTMTDYMGNSIEFSVFNLITGALEQAYKNAFSTTSTIYTISTMTSVTSKTSTTNTTTTNTTQTITSQTTMTTRTTLTTRTSRTTRTSLTTVTTYITTATIIKTTTTKTTRRTITTTAHSTTTTSTTVPKSTSTTTTLVFPTPKLKLGGFFSFSSSSASVLTGIGSYGSLQNIAFIIDYDIIRYMGVGAGLNYETKGFSYDIAIITADSLSIPLYLKGQLPLGWFTPYLSLGAVLGLGLSSKITVYNSSTQPDNEVDFTSHNSILFYLLIGLGIEWNINPFEAFVDFRYYIDPGISIQAGSYNIPVTFGSGIYVFTHPNLSTSIMTLSFGLKFGIGDEGY